jgi:hypothetical protein
LISRGFPKRLSVCSKSLRNAKDQNTPFQTRGPKRAVETPERQGTQLCTFRFGRSGNGTRVQLWISYMHIVREPETAPGSNYGFSVCILCESRKRHRGPIMDFLCAYCARAGKGTLHQHPVSYLSMSKLMFKISDHLHTTMDYTPLPRPASIRRAANIRRREWRDKCRQALSDHLSMIDSDLWTVPQLTKL